MQLSAHSGHTKSKKFFSPIAEKKLADLSLCRMVLPVFAVKFCQTDLIQLDGMSDGIVALGVCVCGA